MSDNVTIPVTGSGTATPVIATDDVSSVHFQKVKLDVGTNGVSTPVDTDNPLPVEVVLISQSVSVDDGSNTLSIDDGAGNISIDDGGNSITVDNNGTFAVQATLQASTNTQEVVGDAAHDAAVAGNPVLVGGYASTAAPSDVSADGDVARIWTTVKGAVNVADAGGSLTVDGTVTASITAGATTIAKAEDTASADADVGVPAMAIRKATPANTSGTDGDYEMLQMSAGRLWTSATIDAALPAGTNAIGKLAANSGVDIGDVDVISSALPTGASTSAKQDTQITAEQAIQTSVELIDDAIKADDAAFTPATTKVMMVGFEFDDVSPDSVDEGDAGAARMSSRREVYTQIRDAAGNERGANVNASNQLNVAEANSASALTSLQLIDDVVLAEDAGHSSGDKGVMALTVRQNTAAALAGTDADYQPLITDTNGRLHTIEANSASALTALQLIDDPVITDDAAFTPATSKVMMAGFEADETSTDSVDEGDGGAARMTLDRKVIVNPQPHTAGGLSTFMASGSDGSTALTNSAQSIKSSAGQLYGYYVYNPNSSAQFVHFYNVASGSVTVGTTNPLFTLTVPATSAANLMGAHGITFDTAITTSATSTAGGNGAPTTSLDAVVWYK